MRKVIIGVVAISVSLLSGCGHSSGGAAPDSTVLSFAPTPAAPEPTDSTNIIDANAASAYRVALQKSLAAQTANGLTEVWDDPDGNPAQVVAFDPVTQKAAQLDVIADDVQELDADSMMPTVLLNELDALEGNAATDHGSVTSQKAGTFTVLNHVEDSKYVTVYTLDDKGLIGKAEVTVDDELSAVATFTYALTADGKKTIAKLK